MKSHMSVCDMITHPNVKICLKKRKEKPRHSDFFQFENFKEQDTIVLQKPLYVIPLFDILCLEVLFYIRHHIP